MNKIISEIRQEYVVLQIKYYEQANILQSRERALLEQEAQKDHLAYQVLSLNKKLEFMQQETRELDQTVEKLKLEREQNCSANQDVSSLKIQYYFFSYIFSFRQAYTLY